MESLWVCCVHDICRWFLQQGSRRVYRKVVRQGLWKVVAVWRPRWGSRLQPSQVSNCGCSVVYKIWYHSAGEGVPKESCMWNVLFGQALDVYGLMLRICACMYVCMYVYMGVCMHVCMHVCMDVRINVTPNNGCFYEVEGSCMWASG